MTTVCVTATSVVDDDDAGAGVDDDGGCTAATEASSASDSSVLLVDISSAVAGELVVRDAYVDRSATLAVGAFDSFQRLLDRGGAVGAVSFSAVSSFVDASESAVSEVSPSSVVSEGAAESVDVVPDASPDDSPYRSMMIPSTRIPFRRCPRGLPTPSRVP